MAFGGGEALLLEYDADGDGKINKEEARKMFIDFATAGLDESFEVDAQLDDLFSRADTNSDGTLNASEVAIFASVIQGLAEAASTVGTIVEGQDGAGHVTTEGHEPVLLTNADMSVNMDLFSLFDLDGDAKLSVSEVQNLLIKTIGGMGLSTDWVTEEWVCTTMAKADKDGDVTTLTHAEYHTFVEHIMTWLPMLGCVTGGTDDAHSRHEQQQGRADAGGTSGGGVEAQSASGPGQSGKRRVDHPEASPRAEGAEGGAAAVMPSEGGVGGGEVVVKSSSCLRCIIA